MAIGLFIDGAYVHKVFNGRMDYLKLRKHIETTLGDTVDEAYFFNADDNPPAAEKLHNALTMPFPGGPGFRVKLYWLSKKKLYWPTTMGGGPVVHPTIADTQYELTTQKAVDVGLVFHMTRSFYRRKWNKLVLAAGDADFHEPIQNLVESGEIDLHLIGSINTISQELRPYARGIFEIDRNPLSSELALPQRRTV